MELSHHTPDKIALIVARSFSANESGLGLSIANAYAWNIQISKYF